MKRTTGAWLALWLGLPAAAFGQEKQDESAIQASFKDGLKLRSADGNFEAHIGGRFLEHVRYVTDRPDGARTSADTFTIRQARLEMSGTLYRDYEFKVQADFPTGASANTGTPQDGFIGWKRLPEFSLRLGQFKEPFSQEETATTRFIDFVERSVLNRLVPARDVGLAFYGKLGEGLFEYEAAVFNGQGRAVFDGNDEKDAAARVRLNPFAGFRFGVAATFGDVDNASIDSLDFTTTELAARILDAGGAANSIDGRRTRLGFELSWLYRAWNVRAEYVLRTDEVDTATADGEEIDMRASYVAVTWILTGEDKALENRIAPEKPFDPTAGTWGAIELAFRVAHLGIDDAIFDLGIASAATDANEVTTFTLGANWYLTRNFRVSPNLVLERYNEDVTFSAGRREDSLRGALVRFQIDF